MIKENELPNGWNKTRLNDVIIKIKKINPAKELSDTYFSYVGIASIDSKVGTLSDVSEILGADAPSRARQKIKAGDVLVSTVRPNLNAVALVPDKLDGQICSTGFCVLRANQTKVYPKYLFLIARSPNFVKFLVKVATGASYPAVSNRDITSLNIPLPPLPTQAKIVAILEKAERLREWRSEADELTDEFLRNTFLEMFGDPINNKHNFEAGTIRDLTIKTQYGTSKKANEHKNGIPILRMGNITYSGNFDFTSLKHIEFDEIEKRKYLVNKGELLFNRTNSKELVGKSAVYRMNEPMAFAGYLIKLITDSPATSEFIASHLNSKYGKLYLQKMAKNIVGMANINAQEVQNIPILIPPMKLRQEFTQIIGQVEQLREYQNQSKQHIDDLFNALVQKAFRGELEA